MELGKRRNEFRSHTETRGVVKSYNVSFLDKNLCLYGVAFTVLSSHDRWFGVTYKEDKPEVVNSFRKLIADGIYGDLAQILRKLF